MAVEVAFESPDQISQRLCRYQDQFQYRYTERDEGYRQCLQNASRLVLRQSRKTLRNSTYKTRKTGSSSSQT